MPFGISELYPNPANDVLTINYDLVKDRFSEIRIYNMLGELILTKELISLNTENIDVSALPGGIYSILLISGDKSDTDRFTISN